MPPENDQPHHAWLHRALPGWVQDGLLSAEAAQLLRARYPADADATLQREARSTHWAMVLFGLLGAVLIGGGIILLLAHNWDQLSRPARVAVAFAPLAFSQALAFWMLWSGRGTAVWRETVGTFLALMVGACIALISQTYNLGGDFADFMLVWTLLSLPVAYLLRATLPAIWFCIATVIWGFNMEWEKSASALWFWPLLALVLPLWWSEARTNRYAPRPVLLGWAVAGAGCFGVAFSCIREWQGHHWMLACAGWYAFLYLAGRRWFSEGRTIWHRPWQFIGVIGSATMALMLTFDWPWRELHLSLPNTAAFSAHPLSWLAVWLWPALAALLWLESLWRRDLPAAVVGTFPAVVAVAMMLPPGSAGPVQTIFNFYVFATGVALLVLGVRRHQLGTVNGGMLILSALVLCRFFDSEMGFVLRGVVFIVLGAGFLATNFFLLRRKRAAP